MAWQKLRPLLIDAETVTKAQEVRAYALARRETLRQIKERESTGQPGPGNDPGHTLLIPSGYRAIYTVEQQPNGWCQHISVAVDDPAMWPNPKAVQHILDKCFGVAFDPEKPKCEGMQSTMIQIDGKPFNLVEFWFAFVLPSLPA